MLFFQLRGTGQNIRYSGVKYALGPSKSIRYSVDFIIAGFVIAGFVSAYFTVILLGFQTLFVITGSCYSEVHYGRVPLYLCLLG